MTRRRDDPRGPRRSSIASAVGAVGLLALLVGAPIGLVAVASARFGHRSPLHGMNAPWRWSLDDIAGWARTLAGGIETTDQLVDLFCRCGLVVAWACVAIVVATAIGELAFQLRHGMPSAHRRPLLGLGAAGRLIATALVGLLPLQSAAVPALAAAPAAAAEHHGDVATTPLLPRVVMPPVEPWATGADEAGSRVAAPDRYVVQPGDSIWSIAESLSPAEDPVSVALRIVEANAGATMPGGGRFTTPALIEPGWVLRVPTVEEPRTGQPVAPREHVVEPGDSYWRIAEDALDEWTEAAVPPSEVAELTRTLVALNAPRLGHRDPTLIRPGEVVIFPTVVADAPVPVDVEVPVEPEVPALDPAAPVPDQAEADVTVSSLPGAPQPPPDAVPGEAGDAVTPDLDEVTGEATVDPGDAGPPAVLAAAGSVVAVADVPTSDLRAVLRSVLGSSFLLGAGALVLLESRRRQRLRGAGVVARLAAPSATAAAAEDALRRLDVVERMTRLDVAVRAAAASLAPADCHIVGALITDEGGIEVLVAGDEVPTPPAPWVSGGVAAWRLPAEVPLAVIAGPARAVRQPCPALVHLGRASRAGIDAGDLLLDLEAVGVLGVAGPAERVAPLVRSIAAVAAASPLAETVHIVVTGLESGVRLGNPNVDRADDLATALATAATRLGSTSRVLGGGRTFALRCADPASAPAWRSGESWEPVVVIAAACPDDGLPAEVLAAAGEGGRGLGVVVGMSPTPPSERLPRWTVRAAGSGWRLDALGLDLDDRGAADVAVDAVADLLADVDRAFVDVPVDATPSSAEGGEASWSSGRAAEDGCDGRGPDEAAVPRAYVEPEWSLMVRVLGQVDVIDRDGISVAFERAKALELAAWLSQHRERPTRAAARTALWDIDVRDATFANVVSDARRAMARRVPPEPGEEWIERTLTEDLPLHRGVVSDADLLAARVRAARDASSPRAIEILRPGLALVTDIPFAGTGFSWPDAEGITSSLTLLVTGAAIELARHHLAMGDVDGVFWATGQGLKVLAGHEELIALRMRAHAEAGDLAGVRIEWEQYERALAADPWTSPEPSPKLVAVRRELLGSAHRAVAVR